MPIPVVIFFGATASGKTNIATKIFAKRRDDNFLNNTFSSSLSDCAEVVSADSVQVYKGLKIGSAQPNERELELLPHHLIANKEPNEEFSVSDFVLAADELCVDIFQRGKLPVLLGGTAFFLKNFMYGLPVTPKADPEIRRALQNRAKVEGCEVLLKELMAVDPETAKRLHINDEYRIIRALEVFNASGRVLSSYKLPETYRENYDFFVLSIDRPREELYQRIEARVDLMIQAGLAEEVSALYAKGFDSNSPAMKAIGYREFFDSAGNLKASESIDDIAGLIKRNTKRYAKRQETFFKAIPGVKHYSVSKDSEILCLYKDLYEFYNKYF